jgi:chromosome segregation ATPase
MSEKVEVERLKAMVEALSRAREVFNERLNRLSERMGELRSMLAEREKEIREIKSLSRTAAKLVKDVHPEQMLVEIKKVDAKTEALKSKLDAHTAVMDRILEEFKELRGVVAQFKGIEALEKMSSEVRADLGAMKKIEGMVKRHADKVTDMFSHLQKSYAEWGTLKSRVKDISDTFKEVVRDFDRMRVEFAGVAKRDEFEKLRSEVGGTLAEMQKTHGRLKELEKVLAELVLSSKKLAAISKRVEVGFEERKQIRAKLGVLEELIKDLKGLGKTLQRVDARLVRLEEACKMWAPKSEVVKLHAQIEKGELKLARELKEFSDRIESLKILSKKEGKSWRGEVRTLFKGIRAHEKAIKKILKKLEKRK